MAQDDQDPRTGAAEFARKAAGERDSVFAEYAYFLRRTRKWWMLPVIVVLLAFGVLMVLAATGAAPFIYALF
jgi:hypothetical protein